MQREVFRIFPVLQATSSGLNKLSEHEGLPASKVKVVTGSIKHLLWISKLSSFPDRQGQRQINGSPMLSQVSSASHRV